MEKISEAVILGTFVSYRQRERERLIVIQWGVPKDGDGGDGADVGQNELY